MGRPFSALAIAVVLLTVVGGPVVRSGQAGLHGGPGDDGARASTATATATGPAGGNGTTPVPTDSVRLSVELAENGSATWQIAYRTRLDDPAATAAFRDLQRDMESGAARPRVRFNAQIRQTVAAAAAATGREMSATNFDVRTSVRRIPRAYGVVVYSFQWRGFGTAEDGDLRVGDALQGFFLGQDERLVVTWPSGYDVGTVDPAPDASRDGAVVWRGPTAFGADGPTLHLDARPWFATGSVPVGLAVSALVLVATVRALAGRDWADPGALRDRLPGSDDEERSLLSNEERVVRMLAERGGRVKQQAVAEELEWTATKTSYVVSNLREEDRIRSFRVGRENVLSLADSDATDGTQ